MKKFLPILFLFGCQDLYNAKRPYPVHNESKVYFEELQNIELSNPEYPINIKIKEDGTFWYKFNTLGEGQGIWWYSDEDGKVKLQAERKIFQMNFDLRATDTGPAIEFSDRFGPKFYKLSK